MKKTNIIVGLVVVVVCGAAIRSIFQRVALADHKNATYVIEGREVALVNGISETEAAPGSASKIVTRYFGNDVTGDVNEDGAEDVAFILTQEGSGSGTFYYVAVLLGGGTGSTGTNAIFLGDRIAPQTMEIRNGTIIANYTDRQPNEAMTATPSVGKSDYLIVEDGMLIETPIFIESPEKNASVASPLTVTGVARGQWFFEASFPLVVTDEQGTVLAQSFAQADGEWMTTEYVRFSGTLTFAKPISGTRGTLILKKDNPSGLPEHDDSREVPVIFR